MSLDHLNGERDAFNRTPDGGCVTETGFELVSQLPIVVQGGCDGSEEKEEDISPYEEHVWSCQHRRERGRGNPRMRIPGYTVLDLAVSLRIVTSKSPGPMLAAWR